MFKLFSQWGRSRELRLLDEELRAAGLHPHLVPEAVKLTMLRLLKGAGGIGRQGCGELSLLLAYCILGGGDFAETQGASVAAAMEQRLQTAIDSGDSLDAQLVLLALHAGLVDAAMVEAYGLEVG